MAPKPAAANQQERDVTSSTPPNEQGKTANQQEGNDTSTDTAVHTKQDPDAHKLDVSGSAGRDKQMTKAFKEAHQQHKWTDLLETKGVLWGLWGEIWQADPVTDEIKVDDNTRSLRLIELDYIAGQGIFDKIYLFNLSSTVTLRVLLVTLLVVFPLDSLLMFIFICIGDDRGAAGSGEMGGEDESSMSNYMSDSTVKSIQLLCAVVAWFCNVWCCKMIFADFCDIAHPKKPYQPVPEAEEDMVREFSDGLHRAAQEAAEWSWNELFSEKMENILFLPGKTIIKLAYWKFAAVYLVIICIGWPNAFRQAYLLMMVIWMSVEMVLIFIVYWLSPRTRKIPKYLFVPPAFDTMYLSQEEAERTMSIAKGLLVSNELFEIPDLDQRFRSRAATLAGECLCSHFVQKKAKEETTEHKKYCWKNFKDKLIEFAKKNGYDINESDANVIKPNEEAVEELSRIAPTGYHHHRTWRLTHGELTHMHTRLVEHMAHEMDEGFESFDNARASSEDLQNKVTRYKSDEDDMSQIARQLQMMGSLSALADVAQSADDKAKRHLEKTSTSMLEDKIKDAELEIQKKMLKEEVKNRSCCSAGKEPDEETKEIKEEAEKRANFWVKKEKMLDERCWTRDAQMYPLRDVMLDKTKQYRLFLSFQVVIVLGLVFMCFFGDFARILSTQTPFYTDKQLNEMNSASLVQKSFNGTTRSFDGQKVALILLDGMRYDQTSKNSDLKQFLDEIKADSYQTSMQAQLPSMSVPNWIALATSAKPEMTGVIGNLLVPETKFDSIFKRAEAFDENAGVVASPWMCEIMRTHLPYLGGTNCIPTGDGAEGIADPTAWPADVRRCETTVKAYKTGLYDLWWSHYSNIDMQGHCCGVTSEFNSKDSYKVSVNNATVFLRKMFADLEKDTVVFIVADHGHIDPGGHGGPAEELTTVPLIIYKNNSGLGSAPAPKHRFEARESYHENLDVAPTITAMLGLPVPRQAQGYFVQEVMHLVPASQRLRHYRDLAKQKQALATEFISAALGWNDDISDCTGTDASTADEQTCIDIVEACLSQMDNFRSTNMADMEARNMLLVLAMLITIEMIFTVSLHRLSMIDFTMLVKALKSPDSWRMLAKVVNQHRGCWCGPIWCSIGCWKGFFELCCKCCQCCNASSSGREGDSARLADEDTESRSTKTRLADISIWQNQVFMEDMQLLSFIWGFIFVFLYYFFSLMCFLIVYTSYGYFPEVWDSTYVHTPAAIKPYCTATLVPSIFWLFILHWSTVVQTSVSLSYTQIITRHQDEGLCGICMRIFMERVNNCFGPTMHRTEMKLLMRKYIIFWSVQAMIVLAMMQSLTTFIIPFVFRIPYVDKSSYGYMFRVVTMQFMSMPLLVYCLTALNFNHSKNTKSCMSDLVYANQIGKDYFCRAEAMSKHRAQDKKECELEHTKVSQSDDAADAETLQEKEDNDKLKRYCEKYLEFQVGMLSSLMQTLYISGLDIKDREVKEMVTQRYSFCSCLERYLEKPHVYMQHFEQFRKETLRQLSDYFEKKQKDRQEEKTEHIEKRDQLSELRRTRSQVSPTPEDSALDAKDEVDVEPQMPTSDASSSRDVTLTVQANKVGVQANELGIVEDSNADEDTATFFHGWKVEKYAEAKSNQSSLRLPPQSDDPRIFHSVQGNTAKKAIDLLNTTYRTEWTQHCLKNNLDQNQCLLRSDTERCYYLLTREDAEDALVRTATAPALPKTSKKGDESMMKRSMSSQPSKMASAALELAAAETFKDRAPDKSSDR